MDHELILPNPESYTPLDKNSVPTKKVTHLDSDPIMDFRKKRTIKDAIRDYANTHTNFTKDDILEHLKERDNKDQIYGFDHNYILKNDTSKPLTTAAVLNHSNRSLTVRTNAPGLQVYTSNYLKNDMAFKDDAQYKQWQGICLETQHFPDSINVGEDHREFEGGRCVILEPGGGNYEHIVEYQLDF